MVVSPLAARRAHIVLATSALFLLVGCSGPGEGPDAGGCVINCEDGGLLDAGQSARPAGSVLSTTPVDAGVNPADAGFNGFPALTDYYLCENDVDCPIELGDCVKEIPFNRPAAGRTSLPLSELDLRVAQGQGVCSRHCTLDATACGELSLRNPDGEKVPFVCQVVAVGPASYPSPRPAFPFDTSLDFDELAAGQAFAAICRPPFQLHNDVANDFCGRCDDNTACSGVCVDPLTGLARQNGASSAGVCHAPASATGACPIGFKAQTFAGGSAPVCAPLQETCGGCLDRDADGTGTGHCFSKSFDCDDRDPRAFFSASSPHHPFPQFCGAHDYNCNGRSDDSEVVGNPDYKTAHCEFCGDDLDGKSVKTGTSSEALLACVNGTLQVDACATSGRIHCAGDVRATGCEATGQQGGTLYYRDADGDGVGNTTVTALACPGGAPPSGYVAQSGDCNDSNPAIHPGAKDVCECWGNCATAGVRIDNDCDGSIDEDVPAYYWFSDSDNDGAPGAVAFASARYCGLPAAGAYVPSLSLSAAGRDCNDSDATRFGAHARVVTAAYVPVALPLATQPPRDGNGHLYFLATPARAEFCDAKDNDCNGAIDDGVSNVYYRDADNDGWGSAQTTNACSAPSGYVAQSGDCNDANSNIRPGATEICDGVDQNCNGTADDGVPLGASCTVPAKMGICAIGTQTSCTSGVYVCTSPNTPQTFDDPDPATPEDEDCDGPEPTVYVDPGGGDGNSGTMAAPVASLTRAQQLATTTTPPKRIALSSGTWQAEYSLANGIELVGGYTRSGSTFVWNGSTSTITRNSAAPAGNRAFALEVGPNVSAKLAHLSVVVQENNKASVDQIGLYLRGPGTVFLRNLDVQVERAPNGAAGGTGANGTPGIAGFGDQGGYFDWACGPISGGNGGSANWWGDDGYGSRHGYGGAPGQRGTNGRSAVGGKAANQTSPTFDFANHHFVQASQPGPVGGFHGAGGGGGGGVNSGPWPNTGGGGGSGGCAGSGGWSGSPGGSAFAILDVGKTSVTYDSSAPSKPINLVVNGGGTGGRGGNAGTGGAGGAGGTNNGVQGGYGSGGSGGAGGLGGAGGWNYALYIYNATNYCSDTTKLAALTTTTNGGTSSGGAGGTSGGGGYGGQGDYTLWTAGQGDPGVPGKAGQTAFCGFTQR